MTKLIAHRGNIRGPVPDRENEPNYVLSALSQGYMVELDVWLVEGQLWSGHDSPQHNLEDWPEVIHDFEGEIVFHCKDVGSLHHLVSRRPHNPCHAFNNDQDPYVLTSWNYIWTLPEERVTDKSIVVMPERRPDWDISGCWGICSDYVERYRE